MIGVADCRDRETAAAVLAVMKAGAVLVPLNPGDPPERIAVVAADCGLAAVVTSPAHAGGGQWCPPGLPVVRVRLDELMPGAAAGEPAALSAAADLAYVIYTSGSTGKPKGVLIRHESLSNLVDWMIGSYKPGPGDVVAVMSPLYFDPAAQQIFPAWAAGACLVPVPLELMLEPLELVGWLARRRVTHLDLVTAHWAGIISAAEQAAQGLVALPSLRWLLVGGESMHYEQAVRWHAALPGPAVIVNVYGPTEATVNASEYLVDDGETTGRVPIGVPLPGYRLYVVDSDGRLCPPYAVGELLIGGVGVAGGYTDPDRTEAAFPPDPASRRPGARLYRTGDAARLARGPRGSWVIEFLGRQDGQVKVGGNRIELEEIEAVLQRSPEVSHAAVVTVGGGSARRLLCLYVTREDDDASLEARLRERLASALPAYMVPHVFRRVPSLAYKISGKLDREGLAERYAPRQADGTGHREPGAPAAAVADAWGRAFGCGGFAADDDYFALGGTSLMALEVVAALRRTCGVALRVTDLYRHPTFGALCALIGERAGARLPSEARAGTAGTAGLARPYRVAHLGEAIRLLSLPLAEPDGGYVLPSSSICSGDPLKERQEGFITIHLRVENHDPEAVCAAVGDIIAAHPLLRSTADFSLDPPAYRVHSPGAPPIAVIDSAAADAPAARAALHEAAVRPWSPAAQSPVRAAVQVVAGRVHLLLWISHAVCDGESQSILIGDLETALRARARGSQALLADGSAGYARYLGSLAELARSGEPPGFAETFTRESTRAAARLRDRLAASEPHLSQRTITAWHRPTEAMSAVLTAFAGVLSLGQLPVLTEFHGRSADGMAVIGGLATRVPALVSTADGPLAAEESLRRELSALGRRHADQVRSGRGAPPLAFLRISLFEELAVTTGTELTLLDPPGDTAVYGEHVDVTVAWRPDGAVVAMSGPYDLSPIWAALPAGTEAAASGAPVSSGSQTCA